MISTEIFNPNAIVDSFSYLKVTIKKPNTIFQIPIDNIISFKLIESQDSIFFHGSITFADKKGVAMQQINMTGYEEIDIEFGGNEDNRSSVKGVIFDMPINDKNENDIIVTILFSHAGVVNVSKVKQGAWQGTLSSVIETVLSEDLKVTQPFIAVTTKNKRVGDEWWINPGFSYDDYLRYLKNIAISNGERAAYSLFVCRDKAYFVPRDYFNKQNIEKNVREYTETNDHTGFQRRFIMASVFNPINGWMEHAGAAYRVGTGYNYNTGTKTEEKIKIDDLISNKTFVGKYVFLPNNNFNLPAANEYTGFKGQDDLKGYVSNKVEQLVENLSTAQIQVPGDISLQPGQAIRLRIKSPNPIEDPYESFYSGKWIINAVAHIYTKDTGYVCSLEVYRNAVLDINDESQLKRTRIINAS